MKNGYIVLHFLAVDENTGDMKLDTKKGFLLTIGNVRELLDLDADYQFKRYKRQQNTTEG